MALAEFSYTIQHREGKSNPVPDSFTRAYCATAATNLEDIHASCLVMSSRCYSSSAFCENQEPAIFHSRRAKCML